MEQGTHVSNVIRTEQRELLASTASPPDWIVTFPRLTPERPLVDLEARQHRKGVHDPDEAGLPLRAHVRMVGEEVIEVFGIEVEPRIAVPLRP